MCAEPVKSDSRKTFLEYCQLISSLADKCADKGVFALAIDHKTTTNQTAEDEKWNIGVDIVFTDDNFERKYYLLYYIPVKDQTIETMHPFSVKLYRGMVLNLLFNKEDCFLSVIQK